VLERDAFVPAVFVLASAVARQQGVLEKTAFSLPPASGASCSPSRPWG
jgi:hypothetical protein